MKIHKISISIAFLVIVIILTSTFYFRKTTTKYVHTSNDSFITIIYTDKNNQTHFISYNVNNKKENEFYSCQNTGFPNGSILSSKNQLYFSQKTSDLYYHLFKYDKNENINLPEQLSIPDMSIDTFLIVKDKIYLRIVQKNHHNFQLGIYNLATKKMFISNKEETDMNVVDFSYDKKNNKLYTIEYSTNEFLSSHLPKIPSHSIVEYNANGDKRKEIYKTDVYLNNITVSNDGTNALVSGSTLTPYPSIYKIDFITLKSEILISSNVNNIVKHPLYDSNGNGFFFLGITTNSPVFTSNTGESIKSRGVFYYDLSSKKIKKIFMKKDGTVRNYSIQP